MDHQPAAEPPPGTTPYPLLAYLDELVDQLRAHVAAALTDHDERSIHQGRVATRRLKAACDLYAPVLSKGARKPFVAELRKFRRRLGPLRDLDVMIQHVAEIGGTIGRHSRAAEWATAALLRDREAARAKASKRASPAKVLAKLGQWWGIRGQFAEAGSAVDSLLSEALHPQIEAFAELARLLTERRQQRATPSEEPDRFRSRGVDEAEPDPHQLRIMSKSLRYTLEMAGRQGHELPKSVERGFKQVQEHLGLWHDYVVLADRLLAEAASARLAHVDAGQMAGVLDLAKASLNKGNRELERFHRLWAKRGDAITYGIRDAFPIGASTFPDADRDEEADLSRPQTGLDPDGSPAATDSGPVPPAAL